MNGFFSKGLVGLLSLSISGCATFSGPRHFDFYENASSAIETIRTDLTGDGIPETVIVSYDLNGDNVEDAWAFFPTRYNERGTPWISSRAEVMFLDIDGDRELDYMIYDVNRDGRFEVSETCDEVLRREGYFSKMLEYLRYITNN